MLKRHSQTDRQTCTALHFTYTHTLTQRSFAVIHRFVCWGRIFSECERGQLWSEENPPSASLCRRKIKSNQILCFPNNKPRSHTQQSLTPMVHTMPKR